MIHPDPNQENSAIEITFQVGPLSIRNEAILRLLMHLMKAPCFATLRTTEQLGYTVWSGVTESPCGILSIWFIVQSKDYGPAYLDTRIEHFLEVFRTETLPTYNDIDNIDDISDIDNTGNKSSDADTGNKSNLANQQNDKLNLLSSFETNKEACISKWSEKDKTLQQRSSRFRSALSSNKSEYEFNARFDRAEVLHNQNITLDNVIDCFDQYLFNKSKERKKLSCQVVSSNHLKEDDALIDTNAERIGTSVNAMNDWKASKLLFPSVLTRPVENVANL